MARGSSGRSPNHIVSVLNSPSISSSSSPEPQLVSNMGRENMRQNSQDATMPVTYTPTTHRISKAKKGKRVHACQFPGCEKVFTRAEHRRRHELNHNPEASYRCATQGCKKAFHRADLLARHMERHELESQPEQWESNTQKPIVTEPAVPRCMSMDHGMSLTETSHSHSMSIGSLVGPGIHSDLANDGSLMWSGMDLPLQPRPAFHSQLPESVDDSFYSSPAETCPSPLSDATFSLPPHSSSSISSASVSVIDQYPKNILKSDATSSPLHIHTTPPLGY
ncbi:Zinc finger C2H2 [Penicillium fimorum]|uniref:Zinc finger C2H2 n=1 Tax=Penicillium fimorum TaxID=1882269 RepID=A0A9W9XVF7_9EURO|nr:Zinc finger C2H2 [Penicillium fimorum]